MCKQEAASLRTWCRKPQHAFEVGLHGNVGYHDVHVEPPKRNRPTFEECESGALCLIDSIEEQIQMTILPFMHPRSPPLIHLAALRQLKAINVERVLASSIMPIVCSLHEAVGA